MSGSDGITFQTDQDWGPLSFIFRAIGGWTVEVETVDGWTADVRVDCSHGDAITVRIFANGDEDEPSGGERRIEFEKLARVKIY